MRDEDFNGNRVPEKGTNKLQILDMEEFLC